MKNDLSPGDKQILRFAVDLAEASIKVWEDQKVEDKIVHEHLEKCHALVALVDHLTEPVLVPENLDTLGWVMKRLLENTPQTPGDRDNRELGERLSDANSIAFVERLMDKCRK